MDLVTLYIWMLPIIIWSMIWKGIALWRSGRNNQIAWFVFIFILNTAGILPIIYLLFFQRKPTIKKVSKKRKK